MGEVTPVLETHLPGLPCRRGKVRDVYDLGDGRLLIVATDRISAFDWVLPTGIPDKGRVLTALSVFWFQKLGDLPNHFLSDDIDQAGLGLDAGTRDALAGRSMIVRKVEIIPFECVVRGYLSGSAWAEYREQGTICGQAVSGPRLTESARLDPPLFTPATKAESGHDENISFGRLEAAVGPDLAGSLRALSLRAYEAAAAHADARGLILADTKFEWGRSPASRELTLADEVLTPDSSRYWPKEGYRPGGPQPSFDKQFVRDWLSQSGWDRNSPPPPLPPEIVARTRAKYVECLERLTNRPFPWN